MSAASGVSGGRQDSPATGSPAVSRAATWSVVALLLVLVGSVLVLASVPPVDRDALTHHLAVPKLYLRYGGIVEIPWIEFSYYPENLDLLYMIPLYFGNDIAPKYIHFGFGLLTAWLVYDYLRTRINALYGLLGALVFLSIPVIVKLSVTVYVDLGLIFFSTAALLGLLRWAGRGFRRRDLLLAGACCGLALGTKYNGLVVLFCLTPIAVWLRLRGGPRNAAEQLRAAGAGALFVAMALLVFSPWAIRNVLWTGNPVYPLYQGLFGASAAAPSADTEAGGSEAGTPRASDKPLGHFALRKLVYGESGVDILTIPLRIFFDGEDDNPRYFDGRLNPALLFLPLAAVFGWRRLAAERRQEEQALLLFSVLFLLVVFVQIDMRIRWIAPIIPPLVLLSMFGLRRMELATRDTKNAAARIASVPAGGAAFAVLAWGNGSYLAQQFDTIQPASYLRGQVTRAEYIRRFRGEYPVIEFMNQTLPPESRVMAFFLGGRTYYSERHLDCRYGRFFTELASAAAPADIAAFLRREGYTHLLIRLDMLQEFIDGSVKLERRPLLRQFLATHLRLVMKANGYALFALAE